MGYQWRYGLQAHNCLCRSRTDELWSFSWPLGLPNLSSSPQIKGISCLENVWQTCFSFLTIVTRKSVRMASFFLGISKLQNPRITKNSSQEVIFVTSRSLGDELLSKANGWHCAPICLSILLLKSISSEHRRCLFCEFATPSLCRSIHLPTLALWCFQPTLCPVRPSILAIHSFHSLLSAFLSGLSVEAVGSAFCPVLVKCVCCTSVCICVHLCLRLCLDPCFLVFVFVQHLFFLVATCWGCLECHVRPCAYRSQQCRWCIAAAAGVLAPTWVEKHPPSLDKNED